MKFYRVFGINKKIFFSCVYIKEKYYRVFCINKKRKFSGYNIKSEILYRVFCINKKKNSGYNIRMLEITIDSRYKCDLETINYPNNSQDFWINRRDLEIETKRNWQISFDKYKDLSAQKYRKELTPNVTFQPNKIFVRNDLFEKIIKSCKATNLEFLKLKEKLGLYVFMKTFVIKKSLF